MLIKNLYFIKFQFPLYRAIKIQKSLKNLNQQNTAMEMDHSYIHQKLKNINLNIDSQTIEDVQKYLINDIGIINQIQLDYQIFAALAIVSETKKLPTVDHSGFSNIGIKIENVMSHLGRLSKEQFLDTLNKQLQKLKKAPQNLKKRIQDIRFSYRFYKKYQITFEALFYALLPHKPSQQEFSALFWVLFLYVKNMYIETQNITEAKSLLILIFRMIFENFISQADFNDIFKILEDNIGAIPEISQQKHQFYLNKISERIDFFYKQRFTDPHTNFNKLVQNYTYLDRLVDDMSNEYVKNQSGLKYYNEIDQLSYLELKKNLTPQVFRISQPAQRIQVISKQLTFDSDSQIEQQEQQQTPIKPAKIIGDDDLVQTPQNQMNRKLCVSPDSTPKWRSLPTPKFSSNQLFQDKAESTPISKKIQNEKWMNQKINSVPPQIFNYFLEMFNQLDQNMEKIEESQKICIFMKEKIYQLITDFTSKCQDYQKRYENIFSFFFGNLNEIRNQNQNKQLFNINETKGSKTRQLLIGIGALSCEIFNYINNSISYEFKHHFEVFGIPIRVTVQAIQLFESFLMNNMPIDLKTYIRNLKKRFMVSDIWQNEGGFKLLFSSQSDSTLHQMISKIHGFANRRIQEICYQAKIESKIISKTINIMQFIFNQKPYLFKKNNVDQIILCCIMSCLSINQKHEHHSLELLFQSYNSNIQFAFNSNQLGLKDHQGNEMKILDYYNEVFLQQIQDLLSQNQNQLDDYLLTPVRINQSFNMNNIDKNISKIKQKSLSVNFLFNPQKSTLGRSSYRKQILRQAKQIEMKQQKQQNEQDVPSPTFKLSSLTRHFSFGPGPSQK